MIKHTWIFDKYDLPYKCTPGTTKVDTFCVWWCHYNIALGVLFSTFFVENLLLMVVSSLEMDGMGGTVAQWCLDVASIFVWFWEYLDFFQLCGVWLIWRCGKVVDCRQICLPTHFTVRLFWLSDWIKCFRHPTFLVFSFPLWLSSYFSPFSEIIFWRQSLWWGWWANILEYMEFLTICAM